MDCPHCNKELHFDVLTDLAPESKMSYKISPAKGEFLSAETVGGTISSLTRLLKAVGKELQVKTEVLIEGIDTSKDGEITVNLIISRYNKEPPVAIKEE